MANPTTTSSAIPVAIARVAGVAPCHQARSESQELEKSANEASLLNRHVPRNAAALHANPHDLLVGIYRFVADLRGHLQGNSGLFRCDHNAVNVASLPFSI